MILQDFVFLEAKYGNHSCKRRPRGTGTIREQPKGFKGNTMAKPRPEWTDDIKPDTGGGPAEYKGI